MTRRKNRRVNRKMSVNTAIATHCGAIIAFVFLMVIVNFLASSGCQQMVKRIGAAEKELARLEDSCNREATRWEEMKTPERIEAALLRHGLSMRAPRPDQNVHMKANGLPYPGQISIAKRQKGALKVASAEKATRRRGR